MVLSHKALTNGTGVSLVSWLYLHIIVQMREHFSSKFWFWSLLLAGCQSSLVPVSELAQWTEELRALQPKVSFVAIYDSGYQNLVFIGAKHSNHTDSLAFKLIRETFKSFPVDTLIVEGP